MIRYPRYHFEQGFMETISNQAGRGQRAMAKLVMMRMRLDSV
jgi:hypothetical protein